MNKDIILPKIPSITIPQSSFRYNHNSKIHKKKICDDEKICMNSETESNNFDVINSDDESKNTLLDTKDTKYTKDFILSSIASMNNKCKICDETYNNIKKINNFYNINEEEDAIEKISEFEQKKMKFFTIELYNILSNIASKKNATINETEYFSLRSLKHKNESDCSYDIKITDQITDSLDSNYKNHKEHEVDKYTIISKIGHGSQGEVFCAKHNDNYYAIKKIKNLTREKMKSVKKEIEIMKKIKHDNIIKLHEVLYDEENKIIYLVMDYLKDGVLFSINDKYQCDKFDKKIIYNYIKQIVSGLIYLHKNEIIHNDIKPENILKLGNKIYIIDFGVSEKKNCENSRNGTLLYFSPEKFLIGNYKTFLSDIWALGVVIFLMFYGYFPFFGKNYDEIKNKVVCEKPNYPPDIDENEFDFFENIFNKNQNKRIELKNILKHKLFTSIKEESSLENSRRVSDPFINCSDIVKMINKKN